MKALLGKTALVTGVGRRQGIGYAICEALALEGADIFYTYWHSYDKDGKLAGSDDDPASFAADFARHGITVQETEIDLSLPQSPETVFASALTAFGSIDILINNACVSANASLLEVDASVLDLHYAVNVRATTLLCKAFVAAFDKKTGGKIVNMSSGQTLGVMVSELPYTITKASVEMLSLQLESELREKGITINAVDPGPTDTGWITDALRLEILGPHKNGKINTPQEAAALVISFICGEREAVTGTVLHAER